jgi:hypothetical protein
MKITWKLSCDAVPNGNWTSRDLTALDGDQIIGRVHQVDHGPYEGLWSWAIFPGGPFNLPTSGRERTRGQAGRRVIEAYQHLLESRRCGAA